MAREIERHHDDQEMARLIAGLEQYMGKGVVALVVTGADGELTVAGPVELPIVAKIADALRDSGIRRIDS